LDGKNGGQCFSNRFTCWQFEPVLNGYWKQEQTPGSSQGVSQGSWPRFSGNPKTKKSKKRFWSINHGSMGGSSASALMAVFWF
jgi:hypothetical protein